MGKRVSDLEREVSLLKNRLSKAESFDGSRIVRSGNSRVKVTVYGQVSRSVRFAFDKHNTEVHHVDQDGSGSRLGFLAQGRVDPDLAISGRIVVGWQENRRSATHDGNGPNTRLRSRRIEVWTDHKDLGQLWLGHGSIAGDAAHLITMSGTSPIFGFGGPGGDDGIQATGKDGHSKHRRHGFFSFFGQRENRIMYATPNVMGFRALVSHSEKDTVSAGLHYAGNPFGMKNVRAAMRFGWVKLPGDGATVSRKPASVNFPDDAEFDDAEAIEDAARAHSHTPASGGGAGNAEAYGVSGGIMHVPTGLNLSGSYASRDNNNNAVD
ncbi:MAG: porin, partial [Rhodospirillaceae bacterium]|nr:porin [Rhodospirillaceae bacterium]